MGQHVSRTDFEWVQTQQVHTGRRKIILDKYPEIKKLFGYDPNFKWIITALVLTQFVSLYFLKDCSTITLFVVAYCFSGVIGHVLTIAVHEISHNVAFGNARPFHNRLFGIFANLPSGIPYASSFKKYHVDHHNYLNEEHKDADVPTYFEAKLFCTSFGKFIWVILQPVFYGLRPLITCEKSVTNLELLNIAVQIIVDAAVVYFFGFRMFAFMVLGPLICMGFHPMGGHFISEHYMFKKGFETYSCYGPLNWITFNVRYHNEHHDFPAVPGSKLPEVRRIAAEFYDNLPHHNSWTGVLYDFIMDPAIGPYARVVRKERGLST